MIGTWRELPAFSRRWAVSLPAILTTSLLSGQAYGQLCPPRADHPCDEAGGPGCTNSVCCEAVCEAVPDCCLVAWDEFCVSVAANTLPGACAGGGSCELPFCPGVSELEACGESTNDGCNIDPAAFEMMLPDLTICGTCFADAGTRDTDWYELIVPDADGNGFDVVTVTWASQFPSQVFVLDATDCAAPVIQAAGNGLDCAENTLDAVLTPGVYVVFIAPGISTGGIFEGFPCSLGQNDYQISASITAGESNCGGPGVGNCFTPTTGIPGCSDENCCNAVCAVDPFCCVVEWDVVCVGEALTICPPDISVCGPDNPNDCGAANQTPGCNDQTCCETVCAIDGFCCGVAWDGICATEAAQFCGDGPCEITCPDGGAIEQDACGEDTNGGCNADPPAFDSLADGDIICGKSFASGGTRDIDWYEFTLDDTDGTGFDTVKFTVTSNFPSLYAIVDFSDCAAVNALALGDSDACVSETLTASLAAPGTYAFLIGPGDATNGPIFDAFPCGGANDYVVQLEVQDQSCSVTCPGGGVPEGELCGEDTNGGCNAAPNAFTTLSNNQTRCGTVWAELGARDTDWYQIAVQDPDGDGQAQLNVTLNSEVPVVMFVLDNMCPITTIFGDLEAGDCQPQTLSVCVPAPAQYVVFVGPGTADGAIFEGFPCANGVNDYTLTASIVNASPDCQPPACETGGELVLNQTGSLVTAGLGVACGAGTNQFARSYNLATIPATAGQDVTVYCVQFGVEANTGADRVCTVNVYRDTNGGAPNTANLVLLGSQAITIAAADDLKVLTATFDTPVQVPADSQMVVELLVPPQSGTIFPGCSTDPQTGNSFLKTSNCGTPDYVTYTSIGFPNAHLIQNVFVDAGSLPQFCDEDLNQDGNVDGADLGLLLANWNLSGQGDIDGSGTVNGADLGLLLAVWGPCTP